VAVEFSLPSVLSHFDPADLLDDALAVQTRDTSDRDRLAIT